MKQNRRVEMRALADDQDAGKGEGMKGKVNDPQNVFFPAFDYLEKHLSFKVALSSEKDPLAKSDRRTERLSHDLVKLLRWTLPERGISYSIYDGSALVCDVTRCLAVPEQDILSAAPTRKGQKVRMVVFERVSRDATELRIGACGGHGFRVFAPPGHRLIGKSVGPSLVSPLVHETANSQLIRKSGFLSCMQRPGGHQLQPSSHCIGGYRPKASCEALIDEMQLGQAISEGRQFFQNNFSGLVYAVGSWNQEKGWWDGVVPLEYVTLKPRK